MFNIAMEDFHTVWLRIQSALATVVAGYFSKWMKTQIQAGVTSATAAASFISAVRLLLVQVLSFIQETQLQVQNSKLLFTPTSGRLTFLNASVYVQSTGEIAIIMIPSPEHT